jgi:hypothetical protein
VYHRFSGKARVKKPEEWTNETFCDIIMGMKKRTVAATRNVRYAEKQKIKYRKVIIHPERSAATARIVRKPTRRNRNVLPMMKKLASKP